VLIGSVANGLNSSGGFCAGSRIIVDLQRINGTSFVFSATDPALLAVSATEGINILRNTPSILSTLQENVRAILAVLDRVDLFTIPSHAASPIIHVYLRTASLRRHRCLLRLRRLRTPLPRLRAMHRRSISRAGSTCCRTSWTRCSRRASLNRGRAFASL
jgi:7-keto-8-aminopelargonate synthetase-like enzyme